MRRIFNFSTFMCMAAFIGISSCNDSENKSELSPAVKQYLSMRMGSNSAMAESMSGPINQSFGSLYSSSSNGRTKDTTLIDYPWSCATVMEIDNPDGSITTIHDYGDGCEYTIGTYTYLMFGKYSSTYLNITSSVGNVLKGSYSSSYAYDNYGGRYDNHNWLMNGFGKYSGESEYDTANQKYSGSYAYESETTYRHDSTDYFYKSKGTSWYSDQKSVLEESSSEYRYGSDYYRSEVLKPLVSDYTCYRGFLADYYSYSGSFSSSLGCYMWMTYVKGRERIHYKNGDDEGMFEIDYGDGDCDSVVIIYENGNVKFVDLSKNWIGVW